MKQLYLLAALFFITLIPTMGQSDFRAGFIITHEGDTLQGMVKYNGERLNAQFCQFRAENSMEVKTFTAQDIRYYSFIGDRQYESKKVNYDFDNQFQFLELIVKGKVSLYFFRDNIESPHFYIEKEGILPLTELKIEYRQINGKTFEQKSYLNTLYLALLEANFPQSRIETTGLSRTPLTKLIKEYNQKTAIDKLIISTDTPRKNKKLLIRPGFFIGLNGSSYFFKSQPAFLTQNTFGPARALSFSVFSNFYFFYWKKSFISIQPELNYSNSKINVLYHYNEQHLERTYQLHYLKLPISLKFDFRKPSATFIPFLSGGAFYAFNLSPDTKMGGVIFYKSFNQFYKIEKEVPRVQVGLVASVGTDYKISAKHLISLEARFELLPRNKMNYYDGETITEEEYTANRAKYRKAKHYDGYIFTYLNRLSVNSRIQTATIRAGLRF